MMSLSLIAQLKFMTVTSFLSVLLYTVQGTQKVSCSLSNSGRLQYQIESADGQTLGPLSVEIHGLHGEVMGGFDCQFIMNRYAGPLQFASVDRKTTGW